jgi:hypothetical protein
MFLQQGTHETEGPRVLAPGTHLQFAASLALSHDCSSWTVDELRLQLSGSIRLVCCKNSLFSKQDDFHSCGKKFL